MTEPIRISREQFMTLRHGDVVRWYRKDGSFIERTVLDGPADEEPPCGGLRFPIRRRSWTGRIHTTVGWNDVKHKIEFTGKRLKEGMASFDELERLYLSGFKVAKQIKREAGEDQFGLHRAAVGSVKKCSAFWRGRVMQSLQVAQQVFPDA
jgi:hypothetical protein